MFQINVLANVSLLLLDHRILQHLVEEDHLGPPVVSVLHLLPEEILP